ncbi:hypothetical protein BDZ91DRAFT_711250 [Kalaharituber pfeilii]|nr:hypothetical protein BDZ91DRAFT_711250 [Kalaharituber pfeilii]
MPPPSGPTPKSPIEVLPSMLHAVFIQTANVFSDPRKNNPRAVVSTNAMIRLGIPAVIDRFQYALDCLEVEILRAKAAFRRDLEVIRQRAAEETKAVAEREAQEARAKALAEENAAREKQEKEEKEARVKAAADQTMP